MDTVYDGQAALDCLDTGSYDGAVPDIMMPALDGIEVLRQLRARGDLLPVLLLTAKSETDDKVQGLDSGANDYLTKPFAVRELLARVRAMTRAHSAQTDSRLTLGNITLDGQRLRFPRPQAQLSPGKPGISDAGNAAVQPGTCHSEDRFYGAYLGSGRICRDKRGADIYFLPAEKTESPCMCNVRIRTVQKAGYVLEVEE